MSQVLLDSTGQSIATNVNGLNTNLSSMAANITSLKTSIDSMTTAINAIKDILADGTVQIIVTTPASN